MLPHRRSRAALAASLAWCAFSGFSACDKGKAVPRIDSTSEPVERSAVSGAVTTRVSTWIRSIGPALLIQGKTHDEAIVLLPAGSDTTSLARLAALGRQEEEITLFGREGTRLSAHLGAAPQATDVDCRVWPLRDVRGDGAEVTWAVGFAGGQTSTLPLDSVEMLSSRDSMALAAEASRLASGVMATTAPSFEGLRFTAHDIDRFEASPGVQAIVAHLVRKVNQEANPQEEQTLLIAERDSGVTTGPYQLAYAERTHGLEETTTTPEVIAGVRIDGRPTLIVARDGDEGVAYVLLERTGPRQWTILWTSGLTRCR